MPGATIIILTTYASINCICVYKEYRRWAPNGFWSTPGGSIDAGESPLTAAIRETEEESYLKFTPEELSEPIAGKNCTYYVVYIDYVSKRDFLKKRYETPNLKPEQKEMWNMTFVPIKNLYSETRFVEDVNGKVVGLRDILFADFQRFPEILKKIQEVSDM